jgi:hypothetical protein
MLLTSLMLVLFLFLLPLNYDCVNMLAYLSAEIQTRAPGSETEHFRTKQGEQRLVHHCFSYYSIFNTNNWFQLEKLALDPIIAYKVLTRICIVN